MPTEVVWENYCRVVMSHHQGKSNDHTNTAPTPAAATDDRKNSDIVKSIKYFEI